MSFPIPIPKSKHIIHSLLQAFFLPQLATWCPFLSLSLNQSTSYTASFKPSSFLNLLLDALLSLSLNQSTSVHSLLQAFFLPQLATWCPFLSLSLNQSTSVQVEEGSLLPSSTCYLMPFPIPIGISNHISSKLRKPSSFLNLLLDVLP